MVGDDIFLGEIRMFGGARKPPLDWEYCAGQILNIAEHNDLFSLIGARFGGDGVTTFALPDLRGRVPIGAGQGLGLENRVLGDKVGSETVVLRQDQINHSHTLQGSLDAANASDPGQKVLAQSTGGAKLYRAAASAGVCLHESTVDHTGQGQAHDNMMPCQCVTFIIAMKGRWPQPAAQSGQGR